jgi:ATP-dependent RNA helicase DeaD
MTKADNKTESTDAQNSVDIRFADIPLLPQVQKAIVAIGYELPSPIQAQVIPHLLQGRDILGVAQTGTGKTAAFALPILSKIDLRNKNPQVLVLAPTRELAIQVAEAFKRYAAYLHGFHVLPIYGGQDYGIQLRQLKRGVHVIVGTPGRVMDHMKRGTLKLDALSCLVLDEADEMLRMGFIDDVEWILEQTPAERQTALFSATMPPAIHRIAQKHLRDTVEITIKARTTTVEATRQRYWMVSGFHKLDALTRILEAETFEAILIFVRTRTATTELAAKLDARGYETAALNGEIPQKKRERTVELLRAGKIDIIVATDVAARGLDVDRISHVINYDIPYDTESYVHRIGRTGRAGRSGEAILFLAPRERRMLRAIETATRQKIEMMELPTTESINDLRILNFKQRITDTLAEEDLDFYSQILEQYRQEHNIPALEIAAALAKLVQGEEPLLITSKPRKINTDFDATPRKTRASQRNDKVPEPEEGMERFRIEVGAAHGIKPANIVGAITAEAGIDSAYVGKIIIYESFSTVDLPEGMPREIFRLLKKVWFAGKQLRISRADDLIPSEKATKHNKPKQKHKKKRAHRSKKKGTK